MGTRVRHMLFAALVLAALSTACGSTAAPTVPVQTPQGAATVQAPATATLAPRPAATGNALTEQTLRNGQYQLPDLGAFQLQDGKYENRYGAGATQVNQVDFQSAAIGDLNGDGAADGAVALAWNSGGSGTFIYLLAVLAEAGVAHQAATELLGDRVQVRGLEIENEQVTLTLEDFAPGAPLCCASENATRTYKLEAGKLVVVAQSKGLLKKPAPASVESLFLAVQP